MNDLGFSQQDDMTSRDLLREIILSKKNYDLNAILDGFKSLMDRFDRILIFGGGIGSRIFLEKLKEYSGTKNNYKQLLEQFLIIGIDGATNLLSNFGVIPHIIFTDLDGIIADFVDKPEFLDTFFIVHAHGDNRDKIIGFKEFIKIHPKIIGSTQNDSNPPVFNYGGFTDGDRSLFFLRNFISSDQNIYLIGFDFGDMVGSHSKPSMDSDFIADAIKKKKLHYGKDLIERIVGDNEPWRIYSVELNHEGLLNLPKINDIENVLRIN